MIVPMLKYSFLIYHKEYIPFLEKLQERMNGRSTPLPWTIPMMEKPFMLPEFSVGMVKLGLMILWSP